MAKEKAPAFLLYSGDWLSSTSILLMTPAEEGAYIRLLCHAWMAPDCGLPSSDEELSVLSRLGAQWIKSAPKLRAQFFEHDGRMFNKRLLKERGKLEEWRKKSSDGGKLSAEMRAQAKFKGGSRVVDECLPNGFNQTPTPARAPVEITLSSFSSSKNLPRETNAREGSDTVKAFGRWWVRWSEVTRRMVGEADAAQAWLSMVSPENESAAFTCLESYLASGEVVAGKVRNAAKFLYEEGRNEWRSQWPPAAPVNGKPVAVPYAPPANLMTAERIEAEREARRKRAEADEQTA